MQQGCYGISLHPRPPDVLERGLDVHAPRCCHHREIQRTAACIFVDQRLLNHGATPYTQPAIPTAQERCSWHGIRPKQIYELWIYWSTDYERKQMLLSASFFKLAIL